MAQLMPLPLTVSCFSKIQIGFTFLVPAHLGSPGKRAVKRVCISKTFRDVKFTVDGSAFRTFITLSTKNFCLMLAVHLGLNGLYPSFSGSTQCKEITKINITKPGNPGNLVEFS